MCDTSPIEECLQHLIEKEILCFEDSTTLATLSAVKFPPFTSRFRYLLHNTLQDHPAFQTVSVGLEPNRCPIIFKPLKLVRIADVPEGQTFDSEEDEFKFRTGLDGEISMSKPSNDFSIFVNSVEKLDTRFSESYPFVLVSSNVKYIDIRRTLRAYYRKGLLNCYEVKDSEESTSHILIADCSRTRGELFELHKEDLHLLLPHEAGGKVCNVLHIMAASDKLLPAKPRATVDRSAAANIMSRHLGIAKKPRTNALST